MKILVLGAGGMAGHVIAIILQEAGHSVIGFARRVLSYCDTVVGDAATADLPEIVKDYDAVINCIGALNKSVDAEPHKGIWLNSYLPHLLANCAKRVIHLSTDCVFSGHDGGGYTEDSFRSTNTFYGRSKALGELDDDRNLTIRTSFVGPDVNESGIGLFNWFMKQRGEISGYTGAIWSGVTSITLAKAIDAALDENITGLYHLTNNTAISKFELLKLFNGLRSEPVTITQSDSVNDDKSFVCTRTDFGFTVPSYAKMVCDMGRWVQEYGELYQQYK
jgi:dTDP-4-dehydrorhamnose reductase